MCAKRKVTASQRAADRTPGRALPLSTRALWALRGRRSHGASAAARNAADGDDDGEDEDKPAVEDGAPVDDAGQDDMRAHFPMAFGKAPDRCCSLTWGFAWSFPSSV